MLLEAFVLHTFLCNSLKPNFGHFSHLAGWLNTEQI